MPSRPLKLHNDEQKTFGNLQRKHSSANVSEK
jgi:hypothetical protein